MGPAAFVLLDGQMFDGSTDSHRNAVIGNVMFWWRVGNERHGHNNEKVIVGHFHVQKERGRLSTMPRRRVVKNWTRRKIVCI